MWSPMIDMSAYELESIRKQLRYEYLAIRKYKMYASRCVDPQLKQSCQKMAAKHQEHYLQLLNELN